MPSCTSCGKRNEDDARFCSACGTRFVGEETARELRKTVTIVFSDLAGSTSMGERLDPESLRRVMLRYYAEMRFALERHGGTVEKFIGDAVMAVFGVPTVHEDDALRAVRAAWDMREALERLNDELDVKWSVRLATRTGVNTGEVVAGDSSQGEGMVVGDCVNVAARLEQVAARNEVLIGWETFRLVRHAVASEPVEPLELKGKSEPVPAFRLTSVSMEKAGLERRLDSPLVGRERELSQLERGLRSAVTEEACRLLTVAGAAGVGKSRLMLEFLASLRGRATVLQGRCLSYGEGITFWPVAEVVKGAAGIVDEDSPEQARSKIADLLPEDVRAEVVGPVAAALGFAEGGFGRDETFLGVRRLFQALAVEGPLVVVFDDVHWGEETFLDLVEYLVNTIAGAPVLIVCLSRPELRERRQSLIGIEGRRDSIVLLPLTDADSERLVENLLEQVELAKELSARIVATAQGNPLFVEELLRMMVDENLLARDDAGNWRVEGDLEGFGVPSSIESLLAARLDHLGVGERGVVDRASVIGQEFWRGAVTELSPKVDRADVAGHLETVVHKELVQSGGQAFGGESAYRFAHILIRDVAYGGLLKESRSTLHERFGTWLEAKAGDRIGEYVEILGYHFEQAFRYREALGPVDAAAHKVAARGLRYLSVAGKDAHARGDMPAAVKLLERALALSETEQRERLDLMFDLGLVLFDVGELTRAEQVLEDTVKAASALEERRFELLARVELESSRIWTDPDTVLPLVPQLVEQAVAVFEEAGDDMALARAWRHLADVHVFSARWAEVEAACERALVHARRQPDPRIETRILGGFATALFFGPTPAKTAIERLQELVREMGKGPVYSAVVDAWAIAGLEAMQGNVDEARTLCLHAKSIFEEFGQGNRIADVGLYMGRVEMLAGDPAAAEHEFRSGHEALEAMGERGVLPTIAAELADAIFAQGRFEEAETWADESARSAAVADAEAQVAWRITKSRCLALKGDLEQAEELARAAVRISRTTDYPNLEANASMAEAFVLRKMERPAEATKSARAALRLYESKGNLIRAAEARASDAAIDSDELTRAP